MSIEWWIYDDMIWYDIWYDMLMYIFVYVTWTWWIYVIYDIAIECNVLFNKAFRKTYDTW